MEDLTGSRLNESILKTIHEYNKYRSPEATAKLVEIKKTHFVIEFKGPFCSSCGAQDFIEDFIYELEDITKDFRVEIIKTQPTDSQSFRVHYMVKKDVLDAQLNEEKLFREFLKERGLSFKKYLMSNACTKDVIMFHYRTWKSERKE